MSHKSLFVDTTKNEVILASCVMAALGVSIIAHTVFPDIKFISFRMNILIKTILQNLPSQTGKLRSLLFPSSQ